MTATQQFEQRIQSHIDRGVTRRNAVKRVVADHPDLHRRLLNEHNGRPASAGQPQPSTVGRATKLFEERVRELTASGQTRAQAIRRVCIDEPVLQSMYLAEQNGRPWRAGASG